MALPRSESQTQHDDTPAAGDVSVRGETVPVAIEWDRDVTCGFSILFRGALRPTATPASDEPDATVSEHDSGARELSGSIRGETASVALTGELLAATFDGPAPTMTVDGELVDPGHWPTVETYAASVAGQEPVADPFPNRGMLGKPLGDPLAPEHHEIELDCDDVDAGQSYRLEVDGDVLDAPDGATVSGDGVAVTGQLSSGETATVAIRGIVTWIETADGIDHSLRSRT